MIPDLDHVRLWSKHIVSDITPPERSSVSGFGIAPTSSKMARQFIAGMDGSNKIVSPVIFDVLVKSRF